MRPRSGALPKEGEEKANRDTKRLEIAVTPTKQTAETSSNRDKTRPFLHTIRASQEGLAEVGEGTAGSPAVPFPVDGYW